MPKIEIGRPKTEFGKQKTVKIIRIQYDILCLLLCVIIAFLLFALLIIWGAFNGK